MLFRSVLIKKNGFFPKLSGPLFCFAKGAGTKDHFSVKNMKLEVGKQSFEGEISWKENSKEFQANLVSPNLDLDLILPDLNGI